MICKFFSRQQIQVSVFSFSFVIITSMALCDSFPGLTKAFVNFLEFVFDKF